MMTAPLPPGWGYHPTPKSEFDRAAAERARQPKPKPPTRRLATRNTTHVGAGRDRLMHLRFARWAHGLGRAPKPGEACDVLGISHNTAERLVADWKTLTKEQP